MFSTLLRSFWWLNERSTSSIKRDIGRQSLKKLMILGPNFRNLPSDSSCTVAGTSCIFIGSSFSLIVESQFYVKYQARYRPSKFEKINDFEVKIEELASALITVL